jgi:hypothetical protein
VLELGDNQTGVTPYAINYCDFDGDGINDVFLTTGQTWWYSSAGTGPWTYLNASTLSLQHGDISLGYFDDSRQSKVAAKSVDTRNGAAHAVVVGGTWPKFRPSRPISVNSAPNSPTVITRAEPEELH